MPKSFQQELSEIKTNSDSYEITVKFRRSLSDDVDVLQSDKSLAEALIEQFFTELQSAYDHPDVAISGSFEIVDGPTFKPL